jgi:hypothetical protein
LFSGYIVFSFSSREEPWLLDTSSVILPGPWMFLILTTVTCAQVHWSYADISVYLALIMMCVTRSVLFCGGRGPFNVNV